VERFLHFTPDEMERYLLKAEYRMGSFLPEFKYVYQSDRSTLKISQQLYAERAYDVAASYFTGVDTVSHLYWHFTYPQEFPRHRVDPQDTERFGRVIPRYYELMDEYLASLLELLGPETTVIIVSDHGFGGTGNLPWSGGHGRITPGAPIAPPGVLILSGPGIRNDGHFLREAGVLDVAPTLLHLLGIPAAADMPGRVLTEAMAAGSPPELPRVASHESIGAPWDPGDIPVDPAGDAERMERLRRLGYIQ
jgi:arylsulfatase A-like enzyme